MRLFGRLGNWLSGNSGKTWDNAFNKAIYEFIGGQAASYDYDRPTYLEKGYGMNPDVYAVIKQQADKLTSIPYSVRKVNDEEALQKLRQLNNATKGIKSLPQLQREIKLKNKAFDKDFLPFPLTQPNPNQTWADIFALYEVFKQSTGGFFLYKVAPKDGVNKGVPQQVYVLPSHLIKIVIKENADMLTDENVIDYYALIEGDSAIRFEVEDVIHVKYANPFFDMQGSHLYGLSPLRAALRNIESSNDAIAQNVKTMKNGGVFGFISGKDKVMTAEQAMQIKESMMKMDSNPDRLSHIAGSSVPVEFTKISLNTDELKPFDYLRFDQKAICNALGWSDKLLNNDEGAKYDNLQIEARNVVIRHTIPSATLLEEALNKDFIPLFKGYENSVFEFDFNELPEMQQDVQKMVDAYSNAPITPNEFREVLRFEALEQEGMDSVWIDGNKRRIDEAGLSEQELDRLFLD